MDLLTRTRALLELMHNRGGADALARAEAEAEAALVACTDPSTIEEVLSLDKDDLPIAFKTAAFERCLSLGTRRPELLRAFAEHLWLHGPEHDERVQALRLEAEQLEQARPSSS